MSLSGRRQPRAREDLRVCFLPRGAICCLLNQNSARRSTDAVVGKAGSFCQFRLVDVAEIHQNITAHCHANLLEVERANGMGRVVRSGLAGMCRGRSLRALISVRRWTWSVVGLEFRRDETVRSPPVTHEYALVRSELGKTAAAQRFHMHKNIGRLRAAGQEAKAA